MLHWYEEAVNSLSRTVVTDSGQLYPFRDLDMEAGMLNIRARFQEGEQRPTDTEKGLVEQHWATGKRIFVFTTLRRLHSRYLTVLS